MPLEEAVRRDKLLEQLPLTFSVPPSMEIKVNNFTGTCKLTKRKPLLKNKSEKNRK